MPPQPAEKVGRTHMDRIDIINVRPDNAVPSNKRDAELRIDRLGRAGIVNRIELVEEIPYLLSLGHHQK